MPELYRRPRRRVGRGGDDFEDERAVRAAAAAVRRAHATLELAEASAEWRELRPRVARWILRTACALPQQGAEEAALGMARVYLRRPEFLPLLPP